MKLMRRTFNVELVASGVEVMKQTDVNPFEPPVNQDHSRERQKRGMRFVGVGILLTVLIVVMMVGLMVLSSLEIGK